MQTYFMSGQTMLRYSKAMKAFQVFIEVYTVFVKALICLGEVCRGFVMVCKAFCKGL